MKTIIVAIVMAFPIAVLAGEDQPSKAGLEVCWFPFPSGTSARCGQGPFGNGTHHNGYYWDFGLREGTPILAPADCQVLKVVDDRTVTGIRSTGGSPEQIAQYQKNSMANANQLMLDNGDGTYSFFWHHKAGTARVHVGDTVAARTHIADVGMSGTYVPHMCFSIHSANGAIYDVRFRCAGPIPQEVKSGTLCNSQTPLANGPPLAFRASVIKTNQFEANGVILAGQQPLFLLPVDKEISYEGSVLETATKVGFYLWEPGKATVFARTVQPDSSGHFQLKVRIPATSRGSRLYTVAITPPGGSVKYPSVVTVIVN